jgi:membrane protease YdiL (CAAX protease family)
MLYHSLSLSFIALILSALSFAMSATLSILLHLWCFPIYYIYLCNDLILLVNSLLLGGVVVLFLKSEKEDIRNIMGPVLVSPWLTIILTAVMLAFTAIVSDVLKPQWMGLLYGSQRWTEITRQTTSTYRELPLAFVAFDMVVSLIAVACGELVWRGYLQTRFERLLNGKVWRAILLQSLLFSLAGGVSPFSFLIGVMAGYLYFRSRRLVPLILGRWLEEIVSLVTIYFT